eukprot:4401096-Pleurochrysis_carterae.AAC.1
MRLLSALCPAHKFALKGLGPQEGHATVVRTVSCTGICAQRPRPTKGPCDCCQHCVVLTNSRSKA